MFPKNNSADAWRPRRQSLPAEIQVPSATYPLVAMQARGYADITPQGQTSMNTSGADCGCRNFGAAPCGYPPALSAVRVSEGAARLGEDWSPPADLNPSPLRSEERRVGKGLM